MDGYFGLYLQKTKREDRLNLLSEWYGGSKGKIISGAGVVPKHPKFSTGASMTKIVPTIGRVVWFTPSTLSGGVGGVFTDNGAGQPFAAIVAHVFSDDMVNLAVFDSNGVSHSRTSVKLVQAGEPKPAHGYYCEWMPYQVGQAAKHATPPGMMRNAAGDLHPIPETLGKPV